MEEDIEAVIEVAAPRERVWRALSEPDLVIQWMGCLGFRPYPGAIFYMQPDRGKRAAGDPRGGIECVIHTFDAPRRLTFSWAFPDNPETLVDIRVRRIPGGAHVKLVHSGWEQFDLDTTERVREGLMRGWHAAALPALKRLVEDLA